MKLLRNREILITLFIIIAVGLAGVVASLVLPVEPALASALLTAAFIVIFLISTGRRYIALRDMSKTLNELLSGVDNIDLSKYKEGELSILESEMTKLVVKLREQAAELKKDKTLLADSIADISHQIRTPLTAMNLIFSALRDPGITVERRRALLFELQQQLDRVDWLVSTLLKLARFDADSVTMNFTTVTSESLIKAALAPLEIMMELKSQSLKTDLSGTISCDPSWLAEALTNIIKNCIEHMEDGILTVIAKENPLYSEIIITDTGSGIDRDDLPHLFERFYRGKNASAGSVGIGLALSRTIILKHNGTIKVENISSGGAKFTVRIYKTTV